MILEQHNKYSIRVCAFSDEDYVIQRLYFNKIKEAGFKIEDRHDSDGDKASYINDFDFRDLPRLMRVLGEDLIVSDVGTEYAVTIYDLPFMVGGK